MDIHAKNEDAHIPLASVEPELCVSVPKGSSAQYIIHYSLNIDTLNTAVLTYILFMYSYKNIC